jgi:AraC-like DNA-binding protein
MLFEGDGLRVAHVHVRPTSSACGEIEVSDFDVLALPLAGVFAKHDGPRRQVVATPDHALFIPAGVPYRLSFPGGIGDRCLVLRWSREALARAMPDAFSVDPADGCAHVLLEPAVMLARTLLWRRLDRGEVDALDAEERCLGLLASATRAARGPTRARRTSWQGSETRRQRQVELVKEAIAVQPDRKWTLGELAQLACVSPGHLAHVFRAEVGTSLYGYVLRSRLAVALHAVVETDVDLTAIALDSGFSSHSHFTARFHALYGHTPQAVRRSGAARGGDLHTTVTAPDAVTA